MRATQYGFAKCWMVALDASLKNCWNYTTPIAAADIFANNIWKWTPTMRHNAHGNVNDRGGTDLDWPKQRLRNDA
jgi:hypothetical protein